MALLQIALTQTVDLSPWSGGGFGMFSTTDSGATRQLLAFVLRPGLRREVEPADDLDDEVLRALTLPTDSRLAALARRLAAESTPDEGPPSGVELQVWRQHFDEETLAPSDHLVRALKLDLARPVLE